MTDEEILRMAKATAGEGRKRTIKEDVEISTKLDFHRNSDEMRKKREISQAETNRRYWLGKDIYQLIKENLNLRTEEQIQWIRENCDEYASRCVQMNRQECLDYQEKVRDSRWYRKNPRQCENRIAAKWQEGNNRIADLYIRQITKKIFALSMVRIDREDDKKLRNKLLRNLKVCELHLEENRERQALGILRGTAMRLMKF